MLPVNTDTAQEQEQHQLLHFILGRQELLVKYQQILLTEMVMLLVMVKLAVLFKEVMIVQEHIMDQICLSM